ncbi:MAG: amino acid ABC transporter permease [Clostridiales bacterium 43-6]|nr:MAG: amino acid ABC transporter permease [Clostridiales bacterium 43-6]
MNFSVLWDKIYYNFIYEDRYMMLVKGLGNTLLITLGSILLGIIIGLFLALFKISAENNKKFKILGILSNIYITVIRGTPVILQLMIIYYAIFVSAKDPIPVAIVAFGVNSGAYIAEIFRAGIQSIDKGQMEAARSLGLNFRTSMQLVVLPQAFKNILPALGNEFITLLKETSVATVIAVPELLRGAVNIRNITYEPYITYIAAALIYLVIVVLFTKLQGLLERRLSQSDHR